MDSFGETVIVCMVTSPLKKEPFCSFCWGNLENLMIVHLVSISFFGRVYLGLLAIFLNGENILWKSILQSLKFLSDPFFEELKLYLVLQPTTYLEDFLWAGTIEHIRGKNSAKIFLAKCEYFKSYCKTWHFELIRQSICLDLSKVLSRPAVESYTNEEYFLTADMIERAKSHAPKMFFCILDQMENEKSPLFIPQEPKKEINAL